MCFRGPLITHNFAAFVSVKTDVLVQHYSYNRNIFTSIDEERKKEVTSCLALL